MVPGDPILLTITHLSGDPEFWGVCDLSELALGGSERMRLFACLLTFGKGFYFPHCLRSSTEEPKQHLRLLWLWKYDFVFPHLLKDIYEM